MTYTDLTPEVIRSIRLNIEPGRHTTTERFGKMVCGVTRVTISRWEHGKVRPGPRQRSRLFELWRVIQERLEEEKQSETRT